MQMDVIAPVGHKLPTGNTASHYFHKLPMQMSETCKKNYD